MINIDVYPEHGKFLINGESAVVDHASLVVGREDYGEDYGGGNVEHAKRVKVSMDLYPDNITMHYKLPPEESDKLQEVSIVARLRAAGADPLQAASWNVLIYDVASKAGVDIEEIANPIIRAVAMDKVDAEVWNVLAEKGIALTAEISEVAGCLTSRARDLISFGEVTSIMLKKALSKYAGYEMPAADDASDAVNPRHYRGFSNGAQVIDISERLSFNTGNAVKYLARAGRTDGQVKGEIIQDLEKARWYINREIDHLNNTTPQK